MTIARTIELARQHLRNGGYGGYARILSGSVRASRGARTSNAIRKAIADDGMERLFLNYATPCPTANEEGCERLALFVELFCKLSSGAQDFIMAKLEMELRDQMAADSARDCDERGTR